MNIRCYPDHARSRPGYRAYFLFNRVSGGGRVGEIECTSSPRWCKARVQGRVVAEGATKAGVLAEVQEMYRDEVEVGTMRRQWGINESRDGRAISHRPYEGER